MRSSTFNRGRNTLHYFNRILCVASGLVIVAGIANLPLDAAEEEELVKKITEVVRNGSPAPPSRGVMLARLTAELRTRSPDEPVDPRLDLAYGLALANLGKTLDASKLLSTAAEQLDADLRLIARLGKAWSLISEKKYSDSLNELAEMGPEIADRPPEEEMITGELIEFCGRLFAFLDGPKESLRIAGIERKKDEFRTKLSPEQQQLFDSIFDETMTQYLEIKNDYLASQVEDKQLAAQKRDRLEEEVDQAKSRLDRARANIEESTDSERSRLSAARNALDAQFGADRDASFRLSNEILQLRNENAYLQSLIDRCFRIVTDSQGRRIRECTDPIRVRRWEQQILDNERLIRFHSQQHFSLELRGDRRVRERERLARSEQLAANELAQRRAELDRKERALEKKEGKVLAAAKPVDESTKTSAIFRRMNALSTYAEFPYRFASKRLLERLQQ